MMPNRMGCWLRSRFFAVVISCVLIISVSPASAATVTETIFSENFEGAFGDDINGWSVGDSNCWGNYDAWDDTFHTSHNGESSAWVADMGQHDEGLNIYKSSGIKVGDNIGDMAEIIAGEKIVKATYRASEGYTVLPKVKLTYTIGGSAGELDHVVLKDGKVVAVYEVKIPEDQAADALTQINIALGKINDGSIGKIGYNLKPEQFTGTIEKITVGPKVEKVTIGY